MPAIGYDDANQSHFTSRHYWEVGEVEPVRPLGLAGPLPRPARHAGQPAPGARARLGPQPALAAADVPVATVAEPDDYDFWTPGCLGRRAEGDVDAFGDLGRAGHERRGPGTGARRGGRDEAGCATSSRPSRTVSRRPPA